MNMQDRLRKRAGSWASQITRNAHKNLGRYKKLINVSSEVRSDNRGRIIVQSTAYPIQRSEYGDIKRVARAYEYGSGLHGFQRKKYKIAPRRAKALAFYWEKTYNFNDDDWEKLEGSPKFIKVSDTDGRLLFRWVDHPGVEAANNGQGYLFPAVDLVRKRIADQVTEDVMEQFIGDFRSIFSRSLND